MADDGVKAFVEAGRNNKILDVLRHLGFQDRWIANKLDDGEHFRLALFPAETATQATWDGVLSVARRLWPSIYVKVAMQETALKETPFSEIEAQAMIDFQ